MANFFKRTGTKLALNNRPRKDRRHSRESTAWVNSPAVNWVENVFVEWLWRNIKYERAYLQAYEAVSAVR